MSPETIRRKWLERKSRRRPAKIDGAGLTDVPHSVAPESSTGLPLEAVKLNAGQRAAMEVAEAARESQDHRRSFAAGLFIGRFEPQEVLPFPTQTAEERKIGDLLVTAVSDFLRANLDADAADETRTIPPHVTEGLKRLGIFRMKVPVEFGGLGLSQVNYNRVMSAIASYCGSTAVLVSAHQSIGVPQPLKMFGTAAQKAKYLPRIAAGELSAFALTEPDVGSDPARMTTTAVKSEDGSHYILNGEKLWTTNGPIADLLVVMAQTKARVIRGRKKPQISAFIVEAGWPGVEAVHRCDFMGLRAIQNGLLRFQNVRVPAENLLWGEGNGLKLALRTLNTGRLTLPAACAGMGKQCLAIARSWGAQREQWGLPIGKHEAGREKIASIAANTYAMEAVTQLTSHWADGDRDIRIEAAMAKLFCSETAWRVIDETMQLRGGRGYERATSLKQRGEAPIPIERMMRDARINRIIEGTTDIMRLFLAREALDPHLRRAMPLLASGLAIEKRVRAAIGLAGYYSCWYSLQWIGHAFAGRHSAFGKLAKHMRFVDRQSHRLAKALWHSMVRHGQKLERKQILLGHLIEIGTELFVMVAACAYAQQLARDGHHAEEAAALAEVFCRQSRRRVAERFRAARIGADKPSNALAGAVMDGSFRWLEEGIIPIGSVRDDRIAGDEMHQGT